MTITIDTNDLPPLDGATDGANSSSPSSGTAERHVLQPEEELRVEIPFLKLGNNAAGCHVTLQKGSCELWGCELAVGKTYCIDQGGVKLALFTWHGCVIDIVLKSSSDSIEISYVSDETVSNVAYVNTHMQLEALRDEAAASYKRQQQQQNDTNSNVSTPISTSFGMGGPRVMVVGPPECGKTSLVKTLVAYATKLGRTPLWVDLDPAENSLSVPGTLTVAPMTANAVSFETFATCGTPPGTTSLLAMWHGVSASSSSSGGGGGGGGGAGSGGGGSGGDGSSGPSSSGAGASSSSSSSTPLNPDLFRAQVSAIGEKINQRMQHDELLWSSGMIVDTNGWIQDEGYQLLLHAASALQITVVLIVGHDRLYSMMTSHYKKQQSIHVPKVLKLPRSGGVVSRDLTFLRNTRSRAMKRYFYGDMVDAPTSGTASTTGGGGGGGTSSSLHTSGSSSSATVSKVPQLTPFLLQIPFNEMKLYKLSSMALSASLLPVAAAQTTDAIQIQPIDTLSQSLKHLLVAVCHPNAVQQYEETGKARALYQAGVAGFCAIEQVQVDTDTISLLCPCAGSLPSNTLLVGEITWMD